MHWAKDKQQDPVAVLHTLVSTLSQSPIQCMNSINLIPAGRSWRKVSSHIWQSCGNFPQGEYGALLDDMLCDRIVTGITGNHRRASLLQESELTLQKTLEICRSGKQANVQLQQMDAMDAAHCTKGVQRNRVQGKDRSLMLHNCGFCSNSHNKGCCPCMGQHVESASSLITLLTFAVMGNMLRRYSQTQVSYQKGKRKKHKVHGVEEDFDSDESIYRVRQTADRARYFMTLEVQHACQENAMPLCIQLGCGVQHHDTSWLSQDHKWSPSTIRSMSQALRWHNHKAKRSNQLPMSQSWHHQEGAFQDSREGSDVSTLWQSSRSTGIDGHQPWAAGEPTHDLWHPNSTAGGLWPIQGCVSWPGQNVCAVSHWDGPSSKTSAEHKMLCSHSRERKANS